jgi:DNA-binding MarR family transcriptional regulator
MDKPEESPNPAMPSISTLTESEERILLALWKMKGIGKNRVMEDSLKSDSSLATLGERLTSEIVSLQNQGLIETVPANDHNTLSLTPLGLAILRQIEEDRLQELK